MKTEFPDAIDSNNRQLALELAMWGMPVVSFFAQNEANLRDMGAQSNQILVETSRSKPFNRMRLTARRLILC